MMDKSSTLKLRTGNKIPVMGLGTWELINDTTKSIINALGLGYCLIDTSSDYSTQPGIGKAIREAGVGREDLYIVTKVEETDDAYDRAKSNLKELELDYVDLLLIHRPPPQGMGEDLWRELIQVKSDGLTRDIGVSNYSIELMDSLMKATNDVPVVNQIEWSPFGYSDEMKEFCDKYKILIMAYSPLTRGKKLNNGTLNMLANKYVKSTAQILIRWNLQRGIVPIPKGNQKKHQEENIDVFNFELSDEDMQILDNLNEEYSSLGNLAYI